MSDFGDAPEEAYESPFPRESADEITGLLHLGYLSRNVSYAGHTFLMRTLRSGEEIVVNQVVKEWDDTVGFAKAYAIAVVSASIELVDGMPLFGALGPDMKIPIQQKFETVRQWFWPTIEFLYRAYEELVQDQIAAFAAFQVKS